MNECSRIVFQKLHISAPCKMMFFPILSCTKKILPLQTSLKQFQLQQSLKNFVSHLIINLQTSAKFLENWIVIFFKESKMLFFTFRLTIAKSNHFSKIIRTLKYHMSNSCQNWSTTCHKFFFKGFGVPSPICRH